MFDTDAHILHWYLNCNCHKTREGLTGSAIATDPATSNSWSLPREGLTDGKHLIIADSVTFGHEIRKGLTGSAGTSRSPWPREAPPKVAPRDRYCNRALTQLPPTHGLRYAKG